MRKSRQGLQALLAQLFLRLCALLGKSMPRFWRACADGGGAAGWLVPGAACIFRPPKRRTARFPVEKPAGVDYGRSEASSS